MNGSSEGNVDWVFKQRIISHSRRRGTFWARIISFSYQTTNKERSRFVRPDDTASGEQVGAFSNKSQYVTTASSQMSRRVAENFQYTSGRTIQLQHCLFTQILRLMCWLCENFIFVLFHCIREQTLQQHVTYHFFSHRPMHYSLFVHVMHITYWHTSCRFRLPNALTSHISNSITQFCWRSRLNLLHLLHEHQQYGPLS